MIGVLVNTATVLLGSFIGVMLKKGIGEKISNAVMIAIGACNFYIGIDGLSAGNNVLVAIISMVLGAIVGTVLDIDRLMNRLGDFLHKKAAKNTADFTQGFVSGSLLFCVGAMTITGSLSSGMTGDHSIIFAKSLLDLVSSMMLASSLGIGVMASAAFVFVFQGALVLLAGVIGPFCSQALIGEISCIGSVIIILLGFNLVGIGKFKVANYLPAILFCPLVYYFYKIVADLIGRYL